MGFVTVQRHYPWAAELLVAGVLRTRHRNGIGRALVTAAETWLRADGTRYLQVKTRGPSKSDANYARTRSFWQAVGFEPLEEIPTLWNESNPALLLIKTL